jgi:hypothetical protein
MILGRRLMLSLALAALLSGFAVTSSMASCAPVRSNNYFHQYWQGWHRPATTSHAWTWVKAAIDSQSPYNDTVGCSPKSCNLTFNWIGLENSLLDRYALLGPGTANNGTRYNIVECFTDANGLTAAWLPASTPGTQPTYEVHDIGVSSGMEMTVSQGSEADVCGNANFIVATAEAIGEIDTQSDQFPGDKSNHVELDNMQVFDGSTFDFLGNGAQNSSGASFTKLSLDFTSNKHMETWDDDCN